ncbi:MAG TPA: transglutaminase domain-containing protein [Spirochaetota bacterium]|jgi:transglutaminase-like putative cysteine protease|nr:MAG: Transglutaminase-like superfamily protein [Spirochaetes bacterium ADurb.Bin133]HNZ25918.1 transglutaminase domain-containing protein [Spirochaetota bacterium]HPY87851.1 transglutaminase domain-containing protein [Spirochaetota bacterium]HQB60916.1 transglutaminase domain-containing protein [Spirochaetota bacterium]
MKLKFIIITIAISFLVGCPVTIEVQYEISSDIIVPKIASPDGGVILNPEGSVYYYNDAHDREASDVRLDSFIRYKQSVKRYMRVSGEATPYDSGYTDRHYHSVLFRADYQDDATVEDAYFSIPVDDDNKFAGYLYFKKSGNYKVYSFRTPDYMLYPRSEVPYSKYRVEENSSTLVFNVVVTEGVPESLWHLIPTRNVNSGAKNIVDRAALLTRDLTNDLDKVKSIYEFFINDNIGEDFSYVNYNDIYPGYLDATSWEDIFIASHTLDRRKGVCNDFAELFAALARSLGYKVKKVSGEDPDNGVAHMWNIIDITGDETLWYKVDTAFAVSDKFNYKSYAEFYPEFDQTAFDIERDLKYTKDYKVEY